MALVMFLTWVAWPGVMDAKPQQEEHGWFALLSGDPDKAAELESRLKNGATPEELNLPSGTTESQSFRTLTELKQEDAQAKDTYPVKVTPPVKINNQWVPPRFTYDFISKGECLERAESGRDEGWIKNHYAWCRSKIVSYGEIKWNPFPRVYQINFRITEIGYGTNSQDPEKEEREVHFDYYIDDIYVSHPSLNGTKLKVDIDCQALVQPEDCKEKGGAVERTIAQWKVHNKASKTLYSTPPPRTDTNPERLGFMEFFTHMEIDPPANLPSRALDSPKQKVRWDSADYMIVVNPNQRFYNAGIFSNVRPVIHFSLSNPSVMREQAQHIKDALESPETTFPYPGVGKIIPGGTYEMPLSRMKNQSDIRRNRRRSQYWCRKLSRDGVLPRPANSECDEFPFASTWQGAYTGGVGKFSVRYISADSNRAGGNWLAAWYAYDRILNNDPFNVRVIE
ncbi:MAG: NucA/NucB deoxyribonuclease domain-containing protein [Planifilum sp.]|jgi:hypothetical protein